MLEGLNPEQRLAVTTTEGPVLIVAGPGSGKTRVLTVRVAFLIEECGVAPWNILAVTFTNKAAREMRDRTELLVGDKARWITIGTFHAFCSRTLRQYGSEIGIDPRFVIYDDSDQLAIVKQTLEALDVNTKQVSPRSVLSQISRAKSNHLTPDAYRAQVQSYWEEIVARAYPLYQETLERRRALDFDDLLDLTVKLLREAPKAAASLRDRYQYILVDEYQDTNRVQYTLVKELSALHRNICVVGDPDQSIYGWRAADIRNILTFRNDYPDAAEIHLEENYRSTPQILSAADAVIKANLQRIDRQLRTANPSGPSITIRECFDETQEARFVVEEISRLTHDQDVRGSDIAVLYRTNSQSRPLEEMFIRAGVPYQLIGGTRFYERKEIKDSMALLRLIANSDDSAAFERVLSETPLGQGIGSKTVAQIEQWCAAGGSPLSAALDAIGATHGPKVSGRAAKLLGDLKAVMAQLRDIAPTSSLTELFDAALDLSGYQAIYETGDPLLAERWDNVLQLRGHLEAYENLAPDERLTTFLEEVALVSDVDTLAEDRDRVTLITLHAVKGLEFKVVFITGVEEGLIPHQRTITEQPDMLEEERRLFYVGITRAMQRLYLTYTFRRSRFGSSASSVPSSFLTSIPPDVVDGLRPGPGSRRSSAEAPPPAPTPQFVAPPPLETLEVGHVVFHARFGQGLVTAVIDKANDQEVTIQFSRHGQKRLVASLANLIVLGKQKENEQ